MTALIDTGVLLAAIARNDPRHAACAEALENEPQLLLPDVVLPEVAYLVIRDIGYAPLITLLRSAVADSPRIAHSTAADLERAAQLLETYSDNHIDFVDCVIVAMAERLNVVRILTLDRRHFGVIRPSHIPAFEIIP